MADINYEYQVACNEVVNGPAAGWSTQIDRLRTLDLRGQLPATMFMVLEVTGRSRLGEVAEARQVVTQYFQQGGDAAFMDQMLRACPEAHSQKFTNFIEELAGIGQAIHASQQARVAQPAAVASRAPASSSSQRPKAQSASGSAQIARLSLLLSSSSYLGCVLTFVVYVFAILLGIGSAQYGGNLLTAALVGFMGGCFLQILCVLLALSGLVLGIVATVQGGATRSMAIVGLCLGGAYLILYGGYLFFSVLVSAAS